MPPAPIVSGRFEVPQDSFDDLAAEDGAFVQRLDLKEILPGLFVGTDRMPRLLGQVWRAAADAALEETRGAYTYRGGNVVEIIFSGLPEGAARARLDGLRAGIVSLCAERSAGERQAEPAGNGRQAQGAPLLQAQQAESAFARALREGLGLNPDDETVRLWCARAMHELLHSRCRIPLVPDMMKLVAQNEVAYAPFLDCETGVVAGSACRFASPVPPGSYAAGEIPRQDIAMLFSATAQLYYMQAKGQEGIVVLPLSVYTLGDAAIADLYRVFLPRLAPEVGHSLVLEIRGLPEGGVWPSLVETIQELSNAVRGFIFETGALARIPFLKDFPTLHACGFSLEEQGLAGGDARKPGARFAAFYRDLGLKTYVKDVQAQADLDWAREAGFTYIFGPAAGPLQKNAWPLQKRAEEGII